jgi:hypothetical protein
MPDLLAFAKRVPKRPPLKLVANKILSMPSVTWQRASCLSKGAPMTADRILRARVTLVLMILLAGIWIWGATRWTAAQLGFQA